MRRLSIAAALAVLGALVFSGSAQACSCLRMKPEEALRRADAAIVGKLVKVVPRGEVQADFRYRVQTVYKGRRAIGLGEMISVRAATQAAACGLPSQGGREYGLLLRQGEGRWWGGLCGLIDPQQLRSAARKGRSQRRASVGGGIVCSE